MEHKIPIATGHQLEKVKSVSKTTNWASKDYEREGKEFANMMYYTISCGFVDSFVRRWRELHMEFDKKYGSKSCKITRLTSTCDTCEKRFRCWTE